MRAGTLFCLAGGVGRWSELVEAVDGAVAESRQNCSQIFTDGQPEPAAALDDGEDRRDLGPSFLASKVQPVLPTDGYGSHGIFSQVVRQLQNRIFEQERELFP